MPSPSAFDALHAAIDRHVRTVADQHSRGRTHSVAVTDSRADMVVAAFGALREVAPACADPTVTLHSAFARLLLDHLAPLVARSVTADIAAFDGLWSAVGRPTFVLSSSLLAELLLTDPSRVGEADVAWPFPAFRVVLPSEPRLPFLDADGQQKVAVTTIDVVRWRVSIERKIEIERFRSREEFARLVERIAREEASVPSADGVCVRAWAQTGVSIFHNQRWDGEADISAWMKALDATPVGGAMAADLEMHELDERALLLAQRVAVNLALYLSSSREGSDERVWTPRSKATGRVNRWEIGGDVRIGREVREAAAAVAAGRSANAPSIRHIVRGHFRNQAVGAGRAERRRIYVAPHWRGTGGEAKTRTYRVQ